MGSAGSSSDPSNAPVAGLRIVALGQRFAGDDGVAFAILRELRSRGASSSRVELCSVAEPTELMELCRGVSRVWLVDAAVNAGEPGTVHWLTTQELEEGAVSSVSSHGFDVLQALELCRTLTPEDMASEVRVVCVAIDEPQEYREGLSAPVQAAVTRAVDLLETKMAAIEPK